MYEEILEKIRPTAQEELVMGRVASKLFNKTLNIINKYPEIIIAEYEGSYAKGTWLTGDSDLDLFLIFHDDTSEKDFKEISLKVGFDVINDLDGHAYTRYADHPFVEGEIDGVKINIVPCYDSPIDALKSDTDRTPHHTKLMLKVLKDGKNDQVRLLKYFLKQNGLYGSDIKVQGFSGYSCEVLIAWYGSFQRVLEAFSEINEKEIIGITTKQFDTPVVIIDPVDSNRNLASAFSTRNIGQFILLAREVSRNEYLAFPRYPEKFNINDYGEKLQIVISEYEASPDKLWGQIKKTEKAIKTQLKQAGFEPLLSQSEIVNGLIYIKIALTTKELSYEKIKSGPKIFDKKSTDNFISKNLNLNHFWVSEDNRITCLVEREFTNAGKFLTDLIQYKAEKSGIPKEIIKTIRENAFTVD